MQNRLRAAPSMTPIALLLVSATTGPIIPGTTLGIATTTGATIPGTNIPVTVLTSMYAPQCRSAPCVDHTVSLHPVVDGDPEWG